ncbi:MAG TPA: decarboxylating NADP(+)-dependent phosphogluconate dehydrogenase, partial [Deinococcales bacterium]|nr:decarboxylating NADP(+)-dependent phosphogluconate dehydrogenase [Deinococcales bacterium]
LKDIFEAIAAKVDGVPCCRWLGAGGSGHFVKMVHNGIEYGDMQLIAETYDLLHNVLRLDHDRMADVFAGWNRGRLESYLVEITADILAFRDADGEPLLEKILDSAGQKGTGKWTAVNALEEGVPLTLIGEAVFARFLSALKDERVRAADILPGPALPAAPQADEFLASLEEALYSAKLVSYAQGYRLLAAASENYGWDLDLAGIALIWRGGCIIRSVFLNDIAAALSGGGKAQDLLLDPFFRDALAASQAGWRTVVAAAVQAGVPVPALASALTFFDGYRSARVPANLIQAQRDYFGAHTFERTDSERGRFFHADWNE